jgi:hypothetical protein
MTTLKNIQTQVILPTGKTILSCMFFSCYFLIHNFSQHISGFFSLASIKKPFLISIKNPHTRVALLTKTQNGMQR